MRIDPPEPKRILITGATSGIGRATAERFAGRGWEVGVLAEAPAAVDEAVAALSGAGGRAFAVHADLSRSLHAAGLIDRIEARHGPISVLVNNAGIGMQGDLLEVADDDLRRLFEVNFLSMVTLTRDAIRRMAERRNGRIVMISSASARRALPGLGAYAASKAAMHAIAQALRVEARPLGVYVSELLPMSVRTPFFERAVNRSARPYEVGGFSITAETVARLIERVVERPVPELYTSRLARLALTLAAIDPRWLDSILIARRRDGADE